MTLKPNGAAGLSGTLDVELDAEGRRVDVGSVPVRSMGSTLMASVGTGGTDVGVDRALVG